MKNNLQKRLVFLKTGFFSGILFTPLMTEMSFMHNENFKNIITRNITSFCKCGSYGIFAGYCMSEIVYSLDKM